MKKTIALLCMAAGLLSCTKEIAPQEEPAAGVPVKFEISVAETKAGKTAWASGDKIYVFFKDLASKFLVLEYDGSTWTNTAGDAGFVDSDFTSLTDKALTAVHFPVPVAVEYDILADAFYFTIPTTQDPIYNFFLFDKKAYEVSGTTVSATLTLSKPDGFVQLFVPGITTGYTLGSPQIQPVCCSSVTLGGEIVEEELQAGARLSGVADSDGVIFAGRLAEAGTKAALLPTGTFILASSEKIYTYKSYNTFKAGMMYTFPEPESGGWSKQNASDLYVDLGLSVKWAKYNLGATSEGASGDYFSWGELQPKTAHSWSTYLWGTAPGSLTKYNDYDGLSSLQYEDDAAYAALGGNFRMPSIEDWRVLWEQCEKEWTTKDGNQGFLITGKNGASFFLPASGEMGESELSWKGYGLYWSADIFSDKNSAYISFNDSGAANANNQKATRCYGLPVRPVYD